MTSSYFINQCFGTEGWMDGWSERGKSVKSKNLQKKKKRSLTFLENDSTVQAQSLEVSQVLIRSNQQIHISQTGLSHSEKSHRGAFSRHENIPQSFRIEQYH